MASKQGSQPHSVALHSRVDSRLINLRVPYLLPLRSQDSREIRPPTEDGSSWRLFEWAETERTALKRPTSSGRCSMSFLVAENSHSGGMIDAPAPVIMQRRANDVLHLRSAPQRRPMCKGRGEEERLLRSRVTRKRSTSMRGVAWSTVSGLRPVSFPPVPSPLELWLGIDLLHPEINEGVASCVACEGNLPSKALSDGSFRRRCHGARVRRQPVVGNQRTDAPHDPVEPVPGAERARTENTVPLNGFVRLTSIC